MRQFEAFLTNNGNIAVVVKEENKIVYCAFITPKGEWLRECTAQEFENIAKNAMFRIEDTFMLQESFDKVLPENAPVWEFMGSIRVEEDYSSFKPETCNNGGDYAFYTNLDVYHSMINGKSVIRGVTRYSTSAEFEYDELNGGFQTQCSSYQLLNADGRYYYTQGYECGFVEQISQVYKLEDIYDLTSKVIEKDEKDDIIEGEYDSPDKDNVIAKLIMAGASFAPAINKRHR